MDLHIVSIRENLEYKEQAIAYFQKRWASDDSMMVYEDCISHCIGTTSSLPQWYLLLDGERIVGCAGLITNDFISRMDLYPWLCALYIEEDCRGNALGCLLIEKCKADTKAAGFEKLYLGTDHIGYYEHYGFSHIGIGYHPWGETSRIYEATV